MYPLGQNGSSSSQVQDHSSKRLRLVQPRRLRQIRRDYHRQASGPRAVSVQALPRRKFSDSGPAPKFEKAWALLLNRDCVVAVDSLAAAHRRMLTRAQRLTFFPEANRVPPALPCDPS